MKFRLLGTLEVLDAQGAVVDLGGAQPRLAMALLIVSSGLVVTADALVDAIWGASPPPSALGTLQSYVSRLRRMLEPGRARGAAATVLRFEPPGYRLAVAPADVDHRQFEALADRGRSLLAEGTVAAARDVLGEALALWRGPVLAEYRYHDFGAGLIARLEGRRLAALHDRITADLALGRHAPLIGELTELVTEHPLQEALRGHLALALYRSGRQVDALRAIDDGRRALRGVGIAPGPALRELEAAILAQSSELDLPAGAEPVRITSTPATSSPSSEIVGGPLQRSAPPDAASVSASPLVGRTNELSMLRAAFEDAAAATRTVIVEGEPGIGKTRLVEELAAAAAGAGANVLWGRAFEGGASPAFWPWLPPLRALAQGAPEGSVAPDLVQLLAPHTAAGASWREHGSTDGGGYALVDGVVELLRSRAADAPLVIVLDDLHWADISSLELLTSVTGRLVDAPLLVVVTLRELDVGRNDALVDTLAALTRRTGTRRVHLRGLSPEDTNTLVQQTVGHAAPAVLAEVHERAEGNPFYITELARLLVSGDELGVVPSGVRDVVRCRLAMLPASSLAILQYAAVIGRSFDLELLASAASRDLVACLDDLEPAVVQRLIALVPDQPTGFRFAHALVREVIVDGLSALARARVHLRVADALEDTDDTAEILAEHLWNAAPVGAGSRAADSLERAAHVTVRRRSLSAAEHLLERAVPLRRTAGDRDAELRTLELLISVIGARRGQAYLINSPLLSRAKQLAVELGDDHRLQSLLWVEWAGLDQACLLDKADPIAAELLARARRADSPLAKVIGHEAWGIHLWHHGHIADAAEHFDAAVEAGGHLPPGERSALLEPDQLRLPLPFALYVHELIGDLEDPPRRFDELVRVMPDDPYWELVVRNFEAWGALATGDAPRAERAARRAVEIDPDAISTFWSMQARCHLGAARCQQGAVDEGRSVIEDAWATYTAMGLQVNGATYFAECALALAKAERTDEAATALAIVDAVSTRDSEHYADAVVLLARAALAVARGQRALARELLNDAQSIAHAQGGLAIAARVHRDTIALGLDAAR